MYLFLNCVYGSASPPPAPPPPGWYRVLIFELPLSKTQFLAYLITELKHLDWIAKRVFQINSLL